jgi:hypothetical protein
MSQQINLLNPALIKQKDLLNPNNIGVTLAVLIVLMMTFYGQAQKQLSSLTLQRTEASEALTKAQNQLKETAARHAMREPNKELPLQIAQLEQKEKMQQQVLQTISQGSASPEKGYAAIMRAFAKQSIDGLWLTGFNFDSHTEQLNITGRTLEADLVPEYISRLSQEPALKGKQFSGLNMNQSKADALASNATAPVLATTPITTQDSSAGSKTTAGLPTKPEVRYIEFTLQSIDKEADAKVSAATNANNGGKP